MQANKPTATIGVPFMYLRKVELQISGIHKLYSEVSTYNSFPFFRPEYL